MFKLDDDWVFSASDLVARMECDHRISLEIANRSGILDLEPAEAPGMLQMAGKHGDLHEQRILAQLRESHDNVVEIAKPDTRDSADIRRAVEETREAMTKGASVIYQACFFDGQFFGLADFVILTPTDGYEVYDSKLARSVKPGALLQLTAYSDQVERLGFGMPKQMHVWLGNGRISSHDVDDVLPKMKQVRTNLLAQLSVTPAVPDRLWGEKRTACSACRWAEVCDAGRDADRDLALIAGIRADQRRKLRDAGIHTLEGLASSVDAERPLDLREDVFDRLRDQARLQASQDASRTEDRPNGDVTAERFSNRGLLLLPPASSGDVWFDMEGDPFAEQGHGLEYLFGYITEDSGAERFTDIWAHSPAEEKIAFERFVDQMEVRLARWPSMHIYHYAPYERTAMKRLAEQYGTREAEIYSWLRSGRLVDLMAVFRGSFRVSQRSYSIKKLEPLYDVERNEDVTTAGDSVVDYEAYLDLLSAGEDSEAQEKLVGIRDYNEVDCVSTLKLDRWLRRDSTDAPDQGNQLSRRLLIPALIKKRVGRTRHG